MKDNRKRYKCPKCNSEISITKEDYNKLLRISKYNLVLIKCQECKNKMGIQPMEE